MDLKHKVLTPEQMKEQRLDEVSAYLARMYNQILPDIERAITNVFVLLHGLKNACVTKGILTEEEFETACKEEAEKLKEQTEAAMKAAQEAQAQSGPRIITPEELAAMDVPPVTT